MIEIDDCQSLGQLIRQERRAQGLTQVQAAELCGVGVRFLHELEHGKASVQLGKVLDVLSTLGLRLKISGSSPQEP